MEEEKVIHSTAEKELMSLAHEILRHRSRMRISDIQQKALAILDLITPTSEIIKEPIVEAVNSPSALEEILQNPVKEAEFEMVQHPFVESLFEGNNTDFQRIMSMLSSKENYEEAKAFIEQQIQPDYDWSTKQQDLEAFLAHIAHLYT